MLKSNLCIMCVVVCVDVCGVYLVCELYHLIIDSSSCKIFRTRLVTPYVTPFTYPSILYKGKRVLSVSFPAGAPT
jgi:hypothetical protein